MAAIITDDFRRNAAQVLVNDITGGTNNYFVGIGKSDAYDNDASGYAEDHASFSLPVPSASRAEELTTLNNLATISKVGNNSAYRVIPRVYFRTAKRFKVYDPNDPNCFFAETIDGVEYEPCYAINTDLEVFLCLKNNLTAVTVAADEPTLTSTLNSVWGASVDTENNGLISTTSDNYRWAYVCTLNRDSGFFTSQFAAIGNPGDGAVLNSALGVHASNNHPSEGTGGLIYGFNVVSGGSGYTAGSLNINLTGLKSTGGSGDKTDFAQYNQTVACTITVTGGAITSCVVDLGDSDDNDDILTENLLGVVNAHAVPASGSAVLQPMILPLEGVGTDNLKLLPTYYCGIRADFEDDLGGDGLFVPFRQVSLIKNPSLVGGDDPNEVSSYAAGEAAKCLRYLTCASALPSGLETGDLIFDGGTHATLELAITNEVPIGYFDHLDTANNRIYFHQNDDDDDSQNLLEFAEGGGTLRWYDSSASTEGSGTLTYTGDPQYAEYALVDYSSATYEKFGRRNGEVIFIENRAKVTRANDQIEEVRMIIQF
jgi:hypothetical protein